MPELKGMRLASAVSWSYRRCETLVEGWRSSPSSSATSYARIDGIYLKRSWRGLQS